MIAADDGEPDADPPAGRGRRPDAVVRPARSGAGAVARGGGARRSAARSASLSVGASLVRRRRRSCPGSDRRRRSSASASSSGSCVRRGGVGRAGSSPRAAPRACAAPPGNRRTGRASGGVYAGTVPFRAGGAPSMARPERRQDGLGELVGRIVGGPGGLEAEGGADRQRRRATDGSGRRAGRPVPRRIWSRPSSSRISPDRAPLIAGPEARQRWIGRRPGGRRDVAEADDALVVGDPEDASHQPSGASDGPGHAGAQASVADADRVLAQERRAGRRQAFGHAAG